MPHATHARSGIRRRRQLLVATAAAAAAALVLGTPSIAQATTTTDPTQPPGTFTSENLAADRTSAGYFYRIPALTNVGDGVVLAAWDARPGSAADAPNPNSIMQRRSTDGGRTWGPSTIVAAGRTTAPVLGYSDPSYVTDRETGRIFLFFVRSQDQGFQGSAWGNDDTDRQVIGAAVQHSDDGGLTWSEPRLITSVVKPSTGTPTSPAPGDVRGTFATSGEGIQLRTGPHAGRLVQQFAGTVQQANGTTALQAYSVYSDDHGATWQRGAFVGTAMDENKVVELSDGRLLLNSRDSANGRFRKVAISTDGGATWGPVTQDLELPDPTNNASIIRLHPDAPQGSAEARMLLFVNANNGQNGDRVNGSVRLSCDDGETWPGLRTLEPGAFAYASATVLDDGRVGVLWERNYTNDIRFSTFDTAWLDALCAPLSAPQTAIAPGATAEVPITVTNQEALPLSGTVRLDVPAGWTATTARVEGLAPGASTTVRLSVTAAASVNGIQRVRAVLEGSDGRDSQTTVALGSLAIGATMAITSTTPPRDLAADPFDAGDELSFSVRITSTTDAVTTVLPGTSTFTTGFAPTACRWRSLPARGAYTCSTPRLVLTQEDIDRGWVAPEARIEVQLAADPTRTATVVQRGAVVALRDGLLGAEVTGARDDAGRDLAAHPYALGEQVPYAFEVRSTAPIVESVTPTSGAFAPFVPPAAGNCRYQTLEPGASYRCATPRHVVTAQDLERGYFDASTTWSVAATGQTTRVVAVPAAEVDGLVRDPRLEVRASGVWEDADGDGFAAAGDVVRWTVSATNTGSVRLDDVRVGDVALGSMLAGAEASAGVVEVRLTAAQAAAASIEPPTVVASATNESLSASVEVIASAVALPGAPAFSHPRLYRAGDRVLFRGSLWEAQCTTRGRPPGHVRGPWAQIVTDDTGRAVWTPTRRFAAGDVVVHDGVEHRATRATRGEEPGSRRAPWVVVG